MLRFLKNLAPDRYGMSAKQTTRDGQVNALDAVKRVASVAMMEEGNWLVLEADCPQPTLEILRTRGSCR